MREAYGAKHPSAKALLGIVSRFMACTANVEMICVLGDRQHNGTFPAFVRQQGLVSKQSRNWFW